MLKKYSWLITLLAVLTMVLAACPAPAAPASDSGSGDAAAEDAAADSGEEEAEESAGDDSGDAGDGMSYEDVDPTGETVTFWYQHSQEREETLQAIIADFNESNEYGITVNGEYQGGYGDIFNKMISVAGTDEVPNLVVAYQNQAATYQLADTLRDMRPLVDSEAWGLSEEDQADFFPGFFNADIFPSFDNARLGFPPNRSMEMMYYNMDWLAELGFDGPPQTPEEFMEAACAAAETPFSGAAGDAPNIGYQLSVDASRFASWTFAFGGDVFDYDAGQYTYDSEAATAAMTFIQELFDGGCAAEVAERYGDQTDFGNGSLLFTVGSSSGLPFYKSAVEAGANFEWSVAPLPYVTDEPVMNIYGASVSMGQSTPEKELATWLFIKYYTSAEVQADWARASNYFPVRQSVAEGMTDYFAENTAYQTAFDLLEYGQAEPPTPGYDFVRDIVSEVMAAVANGADIAEALGDLNVESNEILAEQLEE